MTTVPVTLDELERPTLLAMAHEYMLTGMLANRGILPQVVLVSGSLDAMNDVAIDLWMGASPLYTHRTRELMGITGDDVEAIMKTLQLDVGFVHQYMDVAYKTTDALHAEFWLNHCGALVDAEPHGEERVFGMCHTIEDPTFDATALATNPRARIRPIHRPPRSPANRHPHCHWTIVIDPENEPVGQVPLTAEVGALALTTVGNPRGAADATDGRFDASGHFIPDARLADLASATLAAMAREFQVQTHLLAAAGHLAVAQRWGAEEAHDMLVNAWVGTAWIAAERLAAVLGGDSDAERIARVLALHPAIPPGYETRVEIVDGRVHLELTAVASGIDDPGHPGFVGIAAAGESAGYEAMVHGVDPTASVVVNAERPGMIVVDVTPGAVDPVEEPDSVTMMRIGIVSNWSFDPER